MRDEQIALPPSFLIPRSSFLRMKKAIPILLIFLAAAALRTYRLPDIPPGLTHDEANHGREAMGILAGDLRFYFPANYGSEPVYSYATAGSMLAFGKNVLALRLVNVLFGLGAMGAAFLWAWRAFDRRTALLAAGVTAVSFWPLASSRQALRAGMLPFFFTLAVWYFWKMVVQPDEEKRSVWGVSFAFGLTVAVTLHIYLAARVAWLIFPIFLLYLAFVRRDAFRQSWRPALAGLLLAGLLVLPMFVYLKNNPAAQTRLTMLDGPLQALRDGDIRPALQNASGALLAFIWPGAGDQFLAYNIPGRPVLAGMTAVFFLTGLLISLWRWRQPNYAFLLIWFGVGIVPSLLTGATANTTRNLVALPAVMLLPAVGAVAMTDWITKRLKIKDWIPNDQSSIINLQSFIFAAWLLIAGWTTARDYFVRWGESPEVRGAYQHTLVEELSFLEQADVEPPVVISSVYPGPAHDPSIGLVLAPAASSEMRWVDARYALLFPAGGDGRILIPASTPLHPELGQFVTRVTAVALRDDDLDPSFALYELNPDQLTPWVNTELANFDNAVTLRAAYWTPAAAPPGRTADLVTIWQVLDPVRVGPAVPPFDATDVVMFAQLLDHSGQVAAQRDALDAPSWSWQSGDIIIQVHPLAIPPELPPGSYQTIVGIYDRLSGARLPVAAGGDFVHAPPLEVSSP